MDNRGFLERANLLLTQGRPKDAETWVRKALETEPGNVHALSLLARCQLDLHHYDEAIKLLQQCIAIDPSDTHYYYLLSFTYYKMDSATAALQFINKAIEMNPYHGEYFGLKAYILLGEKKFREALEKANEGLAIDAENITCLNARSTALNKLKMTDEAIATMQNALAKDPDNEFTHLTIGWNLLEKGRHTEAREHFREALRIDPDMHNAKLGLKEALKSKIPPYRWLLQFGFWMQNKGKTFRWIFLIGLFVTVRVIVSASMRNKNTESIGWVVGGAYFIFMAMSWVINPLANSFLLFHKDGKHALDAGEKWNAKSFMICVVLSIAWLLVGGLGMEGEHKNDMISAGLILLSLCIPAGHIKFPVRFKGVAIADGIALGLGLLACISAIGSVLTKGPLEIIFISYTILFVIYTWTKSTSS